MRIGTYNFSTITLLNIGGIVVVVYMVILLGQTIKLNYEKSRDISQLNAEVTLLKAQKDQLNYQLKYYGTASYQERQAHSQLGLVKPGETEVVLPTPSVTPVPATDTVAATGKKSNWSQWLSFLSGNQASN